MTETEPIGVPSVPIEEKPEPLSVEQRLENSEARVAELESSLRTALTEAELAANEPRKDSWKPLALGACFAALAFAIGIGLLTRDRLATQSRYAKTAAELATLKEKAESAEKRVYDQNRELAELTSKLRDRDIRVGKLNAEVMRLNQKVLLVAKEREALRGLISSRLSANQPAPVVVSPTFTDDDPPQVRPTRRRRRRSSSD